MSSLRPQNPDTQCGVTKPSAGRKRSFAAKRSTKLSKPGHIARPPNSFFLFRNDYVKNHYPLPKGMKITELSKMLGSIWRSLPRAEKLPWEESAERLKEEHSKNNPGYKYSPNRRKGNQRQGKKPQRSNKSPNAVTILESRDLTPPPPSQEDSFPRDLIPQGESFSPSNWEDSVLVTTPERPHPPPQHHGQPYCGPLSQQYSSVLIPGGGTNHSTRIGYPAQTNVLPSASPSFSTYENHHLDSGIKLGFPSHLFPSAASPQLSFFNTLESSVQSPSSQEEYFSRMLEGHQITYDSNSNHSLSSSSQPRQRLESSFCNPPIPPGRRDVALMNLERGCNSHSPDHLPWDKPASAVLADSRMYISLTQEADLNTVPPFSTQKSEVSQPQSADTAHMQPSHPVEHLRFNAFGSLQSQHLKHIPVFGTNSSSCFTPSEEPSLYIHVPQPPRQGFEGILHPSLNADGFSHRLLGQINDAGRSFPLHVGDNSPEESIENDGFTPSGSCGSTQGSPPPSRTVRLGGGIP